MTFLAESLLSVHAALEAAGFPHAFGGAIAYGYCAEEPRGTRDVDVNVFVSAERADEVLDALPSGVTVTAADRALAHRDGQVRVFWADMPLDLFFETHEFHREIALEIRKVPFDGGIIPVLGCDALVVFKAMFNRSRDWGDIEEMLAARTVDCPRVLSYLRAFLGDADPSVVRLAALCEAD